MAIINWEKDIIINLKKLRKNGRMKQGHNVRNTRTFKRFECSSALKDGEPARGLTMTRCGACKNNQKAAVIWALAAKWEALKRRHIKRTKSEDESENDK
jgi:hypothetical protein